MNVFYYRALAREKKEFEAQIESLTLNSHTQLDQFKALQQQFDKNRERLNQLENEKESDETELK